MTLSKKLYLAFGVFVVIAAVNGLYSTFALNQLIGNFERYDQASKLHALNTDIVDGLVKLRIAAFKYRISFGQDISQRETARSAITGIIEGANTVKTLGNIDSVTLNSLEGIVEDSKAYSTFFEQTVDLYAQRNLIEERLDTYGPAGEKIIRSLAKIAGTSEDQQALSLAGKAQESFLLLRFEKNNFLLDNDDKYIAAASNKAAEARQSLTRLKMYLPGPAVSQLVAKANGIITDYEASVLAMQEVLKKRNDILKNKLDAIGPDILAKLAAVHQQISDKKDQLGKQVDGSVHASFLRTIIVTLLVITANIAIAVWFCRMLSRRFTQLTRDTESLAHGDLETEVHDTEAPDEIGAVARSLLVFKENLQETKRLEEQQKETEARSEAERKQAMHALADKFEGQVQSIVNTVATAATELAQTAEEMSGNVDISSSKSQDAAASSMQTSQNVQSVASAVEEMSASVREISQQTQLSNRTVQESVSLTQQGDSKAAGLQEAVERVQNAVDIINTIAGQINLLALNATIESARAGEAGRGFAVVAGEVKNLASQTANATQDIATVLSDMNGASQDIIDVLQHIKGSINTVSEVSSSIASAVEEQSATTSEIASNMATASQGTSIINASIGEVSEYTVTVKNSSEQVLLAAKDLSHQSEMLDQEIKQFLKEVRQ